MIVDLLNADFTVAETLVATPTCGEDFCDDCGDCLACYGGDYCPGGDHGWFVYAWEVADFRARHPEAEPLKPAV